MSDAKFVLIRNDTVWEVFDDRPAWADALDVRKVEGHPGIAAGWHANGADAYEAPPPVEALVPSITPVQGKLQLFREGLLNQVEVLVAEKGGELKIWFDTAARWYPNNAYVVALADELGIAARVPDLFRAAAQIEA